MPQVAIEIPDEIMEIIMELVSARTTPDHYPAEIQRLILRALQRYPAIELKLTLERLPAEGG